MLSFTFCLLCPPSAPLAALSELSLPPQALSTIVTIITIINSSDFLFTFSSPLFQHCKHLHSFQSLLRFLSRRNSYCCATSCISLHGLMFLASVELTVLLGGHIIVF